MSCGSTKVACDDGFEVVSKDEGELVRHVQMHAKSAHNKDLSHAEVMKMAMHP